MDYRKALLDPAAVFSKPFDVLFVSEFSREQKIKILEQWEYDARELEMASNEGMLNGYTSLLSDIHEALYLCNANVDFV